MSIFFPLHRGICGPPSTCYLLGSQSRQMVKSSFFPRIFLHFYPEFSCPYCCSFLPYLNICILFSFSSFLPFFLSWKTFTQIWIRRWGKGVPASHLGISNAIKAGMNCLRMCWDESFPYLPGQCVGAQGMACDLPVTTQITQSGKSYLLGKLWAEWRSCLSIRRRQTPLSSILEALKGLWQLEHRFLDSFDGFL